MHKLLHSIVAVTAIVAANSGANAQVTLDLSKVTCDQFLKYRVADPKLIAAWLNGYFHGKRDSTVIDTQKLVADADEVKNYCFKNPGELLMPTVEKIIEPQK
jgi:acid stress chaperone HdeB